MEIKIAFTRVNKYAVSESLVNSLLAQAVSLDYSHPEDDISVPALKVSHQRGDSLSRMNVRLLINVA